MSVESSGHLPAAATGDEQPAGRLFENFQAQARLAPRAAGVYVMRDGGGQVLYVGKSVQLRQRLQQHAATLRSGYSSRSYRWIWHVRSISWQETGSELYALLLEDQLIKQYWPVGNVRQKEYLEYAWLAFSDERLPRLQVIEARQRGQYAAVFGPFHDRYHARDMADLVAARFRLRTCAAVRDGGCLQWEIRKCFAPCRNPVVAANYQHTIARVAASLRAADPLFLRYIDHRISACNQNREFEQAAWLHAMRHRYQALIRRQTFLERFRRHGVVVREKGRWENTFCFCQGKLLWRKEGDLAPEWLAAEPTLDEWQIIDRAGVIWQWLQQERSGGEAAVIDQRWKNIMTWSNDHRTAIFMPAVLDANSLVR